MPSTAIEPARMAAWFQHALGIEHVLVVRGAQKPGAGACCAVLCPTLPRDRIMHGPVAMFLVAMHDVPPLMQEAMSNTSAGNVAVWLEHEKTFYDITRYELQTVRELRACELVAHSHSTAPAQRSQENNSVREFLQTMRDGVEDKTTFSGVWCKMRFGDAELETCDALALVGTFVMCQEADSVLEEMRRERTDGACTLHAKTARIQYRETFADGPA